MNFRRGQKGASHAKFHTAPSKKQACFSEGPFLLEILGKGNFLEPPFASKKVLRGNFHGFGPREYHDSTPPPFRPGQRFGGEGGGSWYSRGLGVVWCSHGQGAGRGIPVIQGGSSASGNTTTPAPWFAPPPPLRLC